MVRRLLALLLALAAPAAAAPDPLPPPPAGVVSGRFVFPERQPWAGEVFTLRLVWQVDWDLFRYLDGDLGWTADPLVTEGWTREPLATPRPSGGRTVADVAFVTRAVALAPGAVTLQPASQPMQIVTGSYETSGMTIATIGPVLARSDGARTEFRKLPPAPPQFSGAVGRFTLRSSLDSATTRVGKPVTWTVTLSGTGNWMGFAGVPPRPLPLDFDMVGKPEQVAGASASLFERTLSETITIMPRRPGRYSLGPVKMTVFDPETGQYRTIVAPAVPLAIAPAPGNPSPADRPLAAPEQADNGLPPVLRGVGHAQSPLPRWAWRTVLVLPAMLLALLWIGLAAHRAITADPDRAARRAHTRLRCTVASLGTPPDGAARRDLIRDWQRDAGIWLRIDHAAPTPLVVPRDDWAQLWVEADRHLYGADRPLPPDWAARADAVLAGMDPPPRFDLRRVFTVANFYPAVVVLCLMLAGLPAPLGAADPPRPQAVAPLDWIGHYNRGRDAARSKDWPLAAAHAGIAWVQAPRSVEARALWTLAAREAGVGGWAAGGLPLPTELRGQFSGLLPPFGWQALTIAAALLGVAGYGAVLLIGFGLVPRRARLMAAIVAALGTIGGGVGWAGAAGYGAAATAEAAITWRPVVLRPLPVDSPETDPALVVAPGSVGHHDAAFMGWSRLTLADGRSGWVRGAELKPLWQAQR